ncbi:uncharacterized protein LOC131317327 [Rhododendron vialii]|uniref:uncharacterized protein LOC131317327 n=1 Tax=Rhododendron vialii TaxID=182163 RepID=UPI00265FC453|nr:uncharacterized protein LOC131317327 [Rhododendron vialii]
MAIGANMGNSVPDPRNRTPTHIRPDTRTGRGVVNHNRTKRGSAPEDRMIMPEMGHIIASIFQVMVVFLSNHQCLTFLPLQYPPLPPESRRLIAIGHVNGDHFVTVHLRPNSPIPPIARNWYIHHYSFADGWDTQYSNKIEEFKSIVGNDVAKTDIIELD